MNVVSVKNVSKYFSSKGKKFYALKDVSFEIKKGEIFGLLGPNGAGKTTLINIMLDLLIEDEGQVEIFGHDVHKGRDEIVTRINSLSTDAKFNWLLTPKEILNLYSKFFGLNDEERRKKVEEMIKVFEMKNFVNSQYRWLSTGEAMRLSLAKSLLNNPELLLMDEPTLGLDPDIAIKTRELIKKVNKKYGTTILLTSHYMQEVEQLCDRIAFMHEGKILDIGSVKKVKLKKFSSYDVVIKLKEIKNKKFLIRNNFQIVGNKTIKASLPYGKNISELLSLLSENGFVVVDVETIKPSLEDYFVKMLSEKNGH